MFSVLVMGDGNVGNFSMFSVLAMAMMAITSQFVEWLVEGCGGRAISPHYTFQPARYHEQRIFTFSTRKLEFDSELKLEFYSRSSSKFHQNSKSNMF